MFQSAQASTDCRAQVGDVINGSVDGPVIADDLLELQPKARIVGDVKYEALEMHQGATIDGELRALKSDAKPGLKLAASAPANASSSGGSDRAAS